MGSRRVAAGIDVYERVDVLHEKFLRLPSNTRCTPNPLHNLGKPGYQVQLYWNITH
jgi:hypothetical protein